MPDIDIVSWQDLTGNKYNKTLHPAMLSERGYIKQTSVRRIGDKGKTMFNVVYDRDYVVEYLEKVVFIKLALLPTKEVVKLLAQAYCNARSDVSASEFITALTSIDI